MGIKSWCSSIIRNHVLNISECRKAVVFVFQQIFKDMKEEDQHTKIPFSHRTLSLNPPTPPSTHTHTHTHINHIINMLMILWYRTWRIILSFFLLVLFLFWINLYILFIFIFWGGWTIEEAIKNSIIFFFFRKTHYRPSQTPWVPQNI